YFTSPEVGYIAGVKNHKIMLFKTIDSGINWEVLNDSIAPANPVNMKLLFFNDTLGVISVDNAGWKTTDAGLTWNQIISTPAYGAAGSDILSSRLAGVEGSQLRYSDDYGVTF